MSELKQESYEARVSDGRVILTDKNENVVVFKPEQMDHISRWWAEERRGAKIEVSDV